MLVLGSYYAMLILLLCELGLAHANCCCNEDRLPVLVPGGRAVYTVYTKHTLCIHREVPRLTYKDLWQHRCNIWATSIGCVFTLGLASESSLTLYHSKSLYYTFISTTHPLPFMKITDG